MHDHIVFVGVYPYRSCLGETPVEELSCRSMSRLMNGYPMDDMVWTVVCPFPIMDLGICRIRARDEGHRRYDPVFRTQDHADAFGNVLSDGFLRRIGVVPLVHVSACTHDSTRVFEYLHQRRNVLICSLSYHSAKILISFAQLKQKISIFAQLFANSKLEIPVSSTKNNIQ